MPDTVTANPGSSGAIFATDVVTSSVNYVLQKIAYGSTGVANLVSTALPFPVASASSGLVQISGTPTVTATAATNPWSSAPGFNLPTVSVSSGLSQVSAVQVSPTSSVAGAGLLVVTSSFGLLTQSTQPVTITSGTVTLSSVHTVTATGPVTVTSGLISITSGVITATAATNPWSSAPTFNVPIVSVSSGLIQISGTPTILSASSGFIQAWPAVTPTSSVAGANLGPVTSSAGVLASLTSGTVSLSSQITVTATGPVTITSGTVTLSSAPLVIVASSGGTQTVIMSSVQTVTATAATNPWSSAPGFNVPVVSVSSGFVQTFLAPPVVTSNIVSTYFFSTGGAASVNIRGSASNLLGYSYFNTTAAIRGIKIYNTSSAPGIGTTTNVLMALVAPGSTGGGGANLTLPLPGLFASNGIGFTMTANAAATDTGAPGLNDLVLTLYFI